MSAIVVTVVLSLLALSVLGWAALAPLRRMQRDVLLPAAPVFGAALVAVVLSTTSWFLTARGGLVVTSALAVGLVVLGAVRSRRPWRLSPRVVGGVLVVVSIGALGAAAALLPASWVGDGRAMSPTDSHDAYFYVAESAWLAEHPISPPPDPGIEPGDGNATPADVPMRASLAFPLRIGQPMVHAALDVMTGSSAEESVSAVIALWVLLVAPAAFVSGIVLRLTRGVSLGLAAASCTSALLLQQVFQQNYDALLGVSLALLTVGLCVAAAERRVPVWPAALVLAGLVGVYTEYLVFVGPAVVGGVLLRSPRGLPRRFARALAVVAFAIALAPTSWVRGAGVLLIRRDGDGFGSPLFSDGWFAAMSRAVGTSALAGPLTPSRTTVPLIALVVVGWLLAVVLDRHRGMWFVLLATGLGYVGYLTAGHHGYTQVRTVSLVAPLLLLTAFAGWGAVVGLVGRLAPRVVTTALVAALVLSVGVWSAINLRTAPRGLNRDYAVGRHLDATYTGAAGWVGELGGENGADTTVLVPDLFSQMWLAYELRDQTLVSYPSLRPDYLGMTTYWAGEVDRYLLVGPGTSIDAPDSAVVASNERFALVDVQQGPVVAVVPDDLPRWSPHAQADGSMIGPDGGTMTVLRSPGLRGAVRLELGLPGGETAVPVAVTVVETGDRVVAEGLDGSGSVVIDLGDLGRATVMVDLGADGTDSGDQFVMRGVTREDG